MPKTGKRATSLFAVLSFVLSLVAIPAGAETVTVTARRANVRRAPDLKSEVLASLPAGTVLQVEGKEGDWFKVRLEGDARGGARTGYISAALVKTEPANAAPPPPAAPAEPPKPAPSAGLAIDHKPVGCVVADRFPRMDACFAPADKVSRASLHFRADGTEHWYHVAMKPEGACYAGVLPKPRKTIKRLNYYIDVVDSAFAESRTQEYAPDVVSGPEGCRDRLVAAALGSASVVVTAATGAPALPVGFATSGVVAASSAGAAGSGAASGAGGGGGAGTAGGMSVKTIGLIAGGVAVGAGVIAAASGGGGGKSEQNSATVDNDGDGLSEAQGDCNDADRSVSPNGVPSLTGARFEAASSTCPDGGTPGAVTFVILADAKNGSCAPVGITSASVTLTVTASSGTVDNPGDSIPINDVPFAPNTLAAGSTTTVRLTLNAGCTNPRGNGVGFTELSGRVTLNTSVGPIAADVQGTNRVNFPFRPGSLPGSSRFGVPGGGAP